MDEKTMHGFLNQVCKFKFLSSSSKQLFDKF